jgi:hypothetical protein
VRDDDARVHLPALGAEVARRGDLVVLQAVHRGVEREHHNEDVGVDHADEHAGAAGHEGDGRLDQPHRQQRAVEDAVVAEDEEPGEGAQHLVDPEGDGEAEQQHRRGVAPHDLGEVPGDGVADRQRPGGDLGAVENRLQEDAAMQRGAEEVGVVLEGVDVLRAADAARRQLRAQREIEHRQLRQHDQQHDPDGDAEQRVAGQHVAPALHQLGRDAAQRLGSRSCCTPFQQSPLSPCARGTG